MVYGGLCLYEDCTGGNRKKLPILETEHTPLAVGQIPSKGCRGKKIKSKGS